MLEWTGERFIPGVGAAELAYEHFGRYLFATRLAAEREVLDIGSGEGYGAFLLARAARRVLGIDVSEVAIEHARRRYQCPNLTFQTSSATALPSDGAFGAITCFELIEHVSEEEQHALLAEVLRVLTDDGLFVISTPNKPVYREAGGGRDYENPYHVREMTFDQFRTLLESYFSHIRWYGQQMLVGNYIHALPVAGTPVSGESTVHVARVVRNELVAGVASGPDQAKYFVAVCAKDSATLEQLTLPRDFVLVDNAGSAADEWQAAARYAIALAAQMGQRNHAVLALQTQVAAKEQTVQGLSAQVVERDAAVAALQAQVATKEEALQVVTEQIAAKDAQLAQWEEAVVVMQAQVATKEEALQVVTEQIAAKDAQLAQWEEAVIVMQAQVATKEEALQVVTEQIAAREQVCSNPIFVIGSPRSGTSILAWSLAQHSQLWTSSESDILLHLFGNDCLDIAFQTAKERPGAWFQEQDVERAEFFRFLGLGLNALFTSRSQGRRWIDQTPGYTYMLDVLVDMFPDAFFIHILRDGRRVVNSMINSKFDVPWATDFRQACQTWRQCVEMSMDCCTRYPTRCLTVVNESLIKEPQKLFAEIFRFIRVPDEDRPAEFFGSNRINSSYQRGSGEPSSAQKLSEPWSDWTLEQKRIFLQEAGDMLIGCGFATKDEMKQFGRLDDSHLEEELLSRKYETSRHKLPKPHITIRELKTQLVEQTTWAKRMAEKAAEREQAIAASQAQVAIKQEALQVISEQTAAKDACLAQQEEAIAASQAQVAAKEQVIRVLSEQIAAKDAHIEGITGTLGWRVLSYFGPIKHGLLLPLYRLLKPSPPKSSSLPSIVATSESSGQITATPVSAPEEQQPHPRPSAFDIIMFPIIDWDFRFQRPQQIAVRFARVGHRVFYARTRFTEQQNPTTRSIHERVFEVQLPGPSRINLYSHAMDERLEAMLSEAFASLRQEFGIVEAVCFVNLPFWRPIALRLRERFGWKIVYDCMDYHRGFSNTAEQMLKEEEDLSRVSDLVLTSSRPLFEAQSAHNSNCILVPNATDFGHFNSAPHPLPDELSPLIKPIIGYYGAISDWFDCELIHELALARPQWSFVLIGRTFGANLAPLRHVTNVHLLGEKPYPILPPYLHAFDICVIPFKKTPLTDMTNPVKLFEFLSAGKAVVATDLTELRYYADYVELVSTPEQWLFAIEKNLSDCSPERMAARVEFARHNTWDERFTLIKQHIIPLYPKVSIIIVTHNNLDYTRLCLESVYKKTVYPNYEVIVVDNASTDGTIGFLKAFEATHPNFVPIFNEMNEGFAAANNLGFAAATGEYIVFLNNDTIVAHAWLSRLITHLGDLRVGMVGPVTNFSGNESRIQVDYRTSDEIESFAERYTSAHAGQIFEISMLALFCLAMRRSVIDEVGLLDERFGVGMFEDDDYALRVKQKGYKVICAEDVFVHHWGRASFSKLDQDEYRRLFDENRRKFEEKWGRQWEPHRYRSGR